MLNRDAKKGMKRMMPDMRPADGFHPVAELASSAGSKEETHRPPGEAMPSRPHHRTMAAQVRTINQLVDALHTLKKNGQEKSPERLLGKTALAGLAHDLKNPMAIINSCAQFCLENETLSPSIKEYLRMIRENARKVNRLLGEMIDSAKPDLPFTNCNLNQVIHKTWKLAILETGYRGTFEAHLAEGLPEISADPEGLARVFVNVFRNAIQAVAQNPLEMKVTVHTGLDRGQNMAEIQVIDNGPGIPVGIQEKVFTPFFTTKREGTGLGLSLCRHFLRQHKGDIAIENVPGGGTQVTMRLPLAPERRNPW